MQEVKRIRSYSWALGIAACAAAVLLACALAVPQAFANRQLSSPVQVSDDITRIHVSKLDSDTHAHVVGATMAIIEKETGVVVDEWVTDGTTHENEKGLDVNVVYILRELSAPAGYSLAQDTEFIVNETEGTGITILSAPSAELYDSYKVSVYDAPDATNVVTTVYEDRPAPGDTATKTTKETAPKTGDETPMPLIAILVGCGVILIGGLQVAKVRLRRRS